MAALDRRLDFNAAATPRGERYLQTELRRSRTVCPVGGRRGAVWHDFMTTASIPDADATYPGQAAPETERPTERPALGRRIRAARRWLYGSLFGFGFWALPKMPFWLISLITNTTAAPITRRMYRRGAENNLIKVYGDKLSAEARERMLTEVFDSMRSLLLELLGVAGKGPKSYLSRIDDTNAKARVAELEKQSPKGWIGITGHLGNWILLASWASSLPGRGNCQAMAKRNPNPRLNATLEQLHDRLDLEAIYSDAPPIELAGKVMKQLRSGARLGIVPDQDTPRLPGVFVDFLGHRAYTATGPASLALAANVPLLPMALVRVGDGFEVIGGEPIYPDRSRPRKEEIVRLTKAWSHKLEEMILQYPAQWSWIHRRWKTTPEKLVSRGRLPLPV